MKFYLLIMITLCSKICYSWDIKFPFIIESYFDIERCNTNWIKSDIEGFRRDLKNKIFGQPFLEQVLVKLLRYHFDEGFKSPKPLVMSFHGSPGTGKTFVSQLIADHIFIKGRRSKFYKHYTMADVHALKQTELIDDVKLHVARCPRSIFVFDEIEKMPDGTFDSIKSFLDYYDEVSNVNFRKSTFIFVSNIGMEKINSLSKNLFESGEKRENFEVSTFQQLLQETTYNADGGLKGTGVVKNYLVDIYLPFLPLEKQHVEQCIRVIDHEISPENMRKIVDQLVFVPPNTPIYSLTGCKTLETFVRRYQRYHDEF